MFKIVDGPDVQALQASLAASVVDIQLAADSLAGNHSFVREKGRTAEIPGVYVHVSLKDAVPPKQMEQIRTLAFRILSRLAKNSLYLCFLTGESVPAKCLRGFRQLFTIHAQCDELDMGGRLVVLEMDVDELKSGVDCLGYFDSFRGVAILPNTQSKDVLSGLLLSAPVPTTDPALPFQRVNAESLGFVLDRAVVVFEEFGNGTRFRLLSRVIPQAELEASVVEVIQGETSCCEPG